MREMTVPLIRCFVWNGVVARGGFERPAASDRARVDKKVLIRTRNGDRVAFQVNKGWGLKEPES